NLLQVIAALHPPCRLAGLLDRWQKQRHQHPNDGNHHQQLDECKAALAAVGLYHRSESFAKAYDKRRKRYFAQECVPADFVKAIGSTESQIPPKLQIKRSTENLQS